MKPADLPKKAMMSTLAGIILLISLGGCSETPDLDDNLREITRDYAFSILGWELTALPREIGDWYVTVPEGNEAVVKVREYFDNSTRIERLEREIASGKSVDSSGLADELNACRQLRDELAPVVERIIAVQIKTTLQDHNIFNPLIPLKINFPPVNFSLEPPPHLLVISPRESIESDREIRLVQEIDNSNTEAIEAAADELGVSSLVVDLGGFGGTYPTFVADGGGLSYTIETAVEEWLHQYLVFTPLGFAYLLDATGISPDYQIATMNETAAGIVSGEIAEEIYRKYYATGETDIPDGSEHEAFYAAMRETRVNVDALLAEGKIDEAESYMEARREYILNLGYYIRKLNQAYFAFHGTYADSPSSVDPIGEEMKELRAQSGSLKEFLDIVSPMKGRFDLQRALTD